MRWVQSHLTSLPADIEEGLTSAAWASMPRVHHKQTSEEEKLTSALAIEPSEASRHRRRIDIRAPDEGHQKHR